MICNSCSGKNFFKTKFLGSVSGTTGFALEPKKGGIVKRGIIPEIRVCNDCGNIMFFISDKDKDKVYSE